MDFRLTNDQLELQEAVTGFCAAEYTHDRLVAMERAGTDRTSWAALADLGVFALRVPEARGGLGTGWVETVVVHEVLGRHLVPGPLTWSSLLAGLVPGVADGSRVVTGLDLDGGLGGHGGHGGHGTGPLLVEHPALADVLVVVGLDGAWLVEPPGWRPDEPLEPLDPLTPVGLVREPSGGTELLDAAGAVQLRTGGAAVTAALLAGVADRALELARAYALERRQFDRPIASFQAIQHLLADMYVRMMMARSAVYAAAALLDDPGAGDVRHAVSAAKVVASDAAMANSRACIQIHGGMGFTWEMMPHYCLKRAWVLEQAFGTSAQHTESLAADVREIA